MASSCLLLLSIKSNLSATPLQKIALFSLTDTHNDCCLCLTACGQLSLMIDETSHLHFITNKLQKHFTSQITV
jgi:hypothetical protein